MNLEVLISTMNNDDFDLVHKMKIQSDAIIVNQSEENCVKEKFINNNRIRHYSFKERGVGLSRNNALMRANGDICLIADDDVVYENNYRTVVIKAFEENPKADIIFFNVSSNDKQRPSAKIKKNKKITFFNSLKFGAVNIAFRTSKIHYNNIYFSLLFGGGAKFGSGEDTLFIKECINKGLNLYSNPNVIGHVSQDKSSWFNGYTEKYFYDKGVLFAAISKRWAKILCVQYILRKANLFKKDISLSFALSSMIKGTNMYRY